MKNIEPLVKEVLSEFPVTRGSDWELIFKVWYNQGVFIPVELRQKIMSKCSSFETIRRTRQKIQHDGLYLPDEKTQKMRKQKAKEMHDKFKPKHFTLVNRNGEEVYIME